MKKMRMLSTKPEKVIIGLDIGSESIKAIKGMYSPGKIKVLDFACRKYEASEGSPDLIAQQINELLTQLADAKKIKKMKVHALISGRRLCIRVVKMPVMPEDEVRQAIRTKVRKYVSPDLDQVIFSFFTLGETQEKDVKKLEVAFAATQKAFFDEYLQYFKLSGAYPKIITSACFSEWNLIREMGLDEGITSILLININSQETDLTVYRENRFVFTRNISIGVRDFADKLKDKAQFSLERPEDIKMLLSLEKKEGQAEAQGEPQVLEIAQQLQNEGNVLCKEIELTANHYYQIMHGKGVEKCILLGEGLQIGGLLDFLKQKLDIPIEDLRIPDEKLQLPQDKKEQFKRDFPLYSQSLGALLITPNDINLFAKARPRTKREIYALAKVFAHPKINVAVALLFGFLWLTPLLVLKGINLYYHQRIKTYEIRRDKLQEGTAQLMEIRKKKDILDFEKGLYLRLSEEYPVYSTIIAEIAKAISSEKIALDECRFFSASGQKAKKFTLAGKVSGKTAPTSEVTKFVLALEQSGYFENISVTVSGQTAQSGFLAAQEAPATNFVINGDIRKKVEAKKIKS